MLVAQSLQLHGLMCKQRMHCNTLPQQRPAAAWPPKVQCLVHSTAPCSRQGLSCSLQPDAAPTSCYLGHSLPDLPAALCLSPLAQLRNPLATLAHCLPDLPTACLLPCSRPDLDFAVSWVANVKRQGITGYIVGAMDDDMLKWVRSAPSTHVACALCVGAPCALCMRAACWISGAVCAPGPVSVSKKGASLQDTSAGEFRGARVGFGAEARAGCVFGRFQRTSKPKHAHGASSELRGAQEFSSSVGVRAPRGCQGSLSVSAGACSSMLARTVGYGRVAHPTRPCMLRGLGWCRPAGGGLCQAHRTS